MVAVELVARDTKGTREAVLSLGCVQFDSVRRVYEARQSQSVTQRLSQTNLISIFMPQKVIISLRMKLSVQKKLNVGFLFAWVWVLEINKQLKNLFFLYIYVSLKLILPRSELNSSMCVARMTRDMLNLLFSGLKGQAVTPHPQNQDAPSLTNWRMLCSLRRRWLQNSCNHTSTILFKKGTKGWLFILSKRWCKLMIF